MKKTLLRSYAIASAGALEVTHYEDEKPVDMSSHYHGIVVDARNTRVDAFLDVFRYETGSLGWSGSPNGHHVESARAFSILLDLFLQDVEGTGSPARTF
jgi:hypothetical protein